MGLAKAFNLLVVFGFILIQFPGQGALVSNKNAKNRALLVGVPDDLQGIDKDLDIVSKLVGQPQYAFYTRTLWNQAGTAENILREISELSSQAEKDGTLFFYYTGHGVENEIEAYGGNLEIKKIAAAIALGRKDQGPLARLVVFFDACRAGTYIDPFKELYKIYKDLPSLILAETLEKELLATGTHRQNWKESFVFASSQADEDSQPTVDGSQFTLALKKSFEELTSSNGSLKEWSERTIKYTEDHRPVPHFHPASLEKERLF